MQPSTSACDAKTTAASRWTVQTMDGAESDGSSTVYISTVGGIVMEQQRAWLQRYRQYPMAKMLRPLRAVRPALRAAWTLSSAAWIPWLGTVCCVESITHPAWTPSTSPAGTLLDHHHPRSVDSILGRQSAGVFRIGRSPGGPLAGGRGEERGAHSRCERQAGDDAGPCQTTGDSFSFCACSSDRG